MKLPNPVSLTDDLQRARSVLAELAETGIDLLSRERHLDVLLALDNLEVAARGVWPPPQPRRSFTDVDRALHEAQAALAAVLADPPDHDVDPLRVSLAKGHISKALTTQR